MYLYYVDPKIVKKKESCADKMVQKSYDISLWHEWHTYLKMWVSEQTEVHVRTKRSPVIKYTFPSTHIKHWLWLSRNYATKSLCILRTSCLATLLWSYRALLLTMGYPNFLGQLHSSKNSELSQTLRNFIRAINILQPFTWISELNPYWFSVHLSTRWGVSYYRLTISAQ